MTWQDSRVWDATAVLAASNEWSWVPDGAPHVRTDEYLVVAYPDYFITPTSARVFGSDRGPADLVEEICDVARGWGHGRLWWRLVGRVVHLRCQRIELGLKVEQHAVDGAGGKVLRHVGCSSAMSSSSSAYSSASLVLPSDDSSQS